LLYLLFSELVLVVALKRACLGVLKGEANA